MDLKLKPFDFNAALNRAGLGRDGMPLTRTQGASGGVARVREGVQGVAGGTNFQAAITQALNQVSQAQLKAQSMQREVALDNPTVSIEETMMAMQKAQIGFQATLQVRNRMVQAYTEIMNMNV
jgi:flagellar hook-basal body complex protein FliE